MTTAQDPVFEESKVVEYNMEKDFLKIENKMDFVHSIRDSDLWILNRWKEHFKNIPYAITKDRWPGGLNRLHDEYILWKERRI